MTVLVIGSTGQVAQALVERGAAGPHRIIAEGRPACDLADPATITATIAKTAPDAIVNAAAYTAVDKAESEEAAAAAINADGVGVLAREAARLEVPLVHLSTDYVFSGDKDGPYSETDPPAPTGAYGRTKRAGEMAVIAAGGPALICRTAWVYSPFGNNFVKTMLRVGATRDTLRVVDDQHGNPTSALDIADGILALLGRIPAGEWPSGEDAIVHLAGTGATTWCGLAREVFRVSGENAGPTATVEAIGTADYPTPALRPANSRLDTSRLQERYGITLPDWRESVGTVVRRLLSDSFPATPTT